jgi:hypothetical protein
MGLPVVTTNVGVAGELFEHNHSALIVQHELLAFIDAIVRLRDDLSLRQKLGTNARKEAVAKFDWKVVAEQYRAFFRQALAKVDTWRAVKPRLYRQVSESKFNKIPIPLHSVELDQMLGDITDRYLKLEMRNQAVLAELNRVKDARSWRYSQKVRQLLPSATKTKHRKAA